MSPWRHDPSLALLVEQSQPVIDALHAHVALLDERGVVVAVNQAWRAFSRANGGSPPHGLGSNYLTVAGGAVGDDPEGRASAAVEEGIRSVLSGASARFQLEYRCDAPREPRWFLLTVSPFPRSGPVRAVVSHENITALKRAEMETRAQAERALAAFSAVVEAIAHLVEQRDPYTAGHQRGVARVADAIAGRLGLDADRRLGLRLGATIHDIGKVAVPAELLMRPGELTPLEVELIRGHPLAGYEVLKGIAFPWPIAEMVYQHHERLDGTGYPRGLVGEEICFEARIIAVADTWDAITTHRPYRPARDVGHGVQVILAGRGTLYDEAVVDALLEVIVEG